MDYSVTFARHFARLVWLLLREPTNVDEQKAALRALVTVSKDGPVTMTLDGSQELAINGVPLPGTLNAVRELVLRLLGHDVREMHAEAAASPADLLNAARALAAEANVGPEGQTVTERLSETGARTVWFMTGRPAGARDSSEEGTPVSQPGIDAAGGSWTSGPAATSTAGKRTGTLSAKDVLARLDSARHGAAIARALEDVITLIETCVRDGMIHVAADAFAGVVQREAAIEREELRRPFMMAVRRLSKPLVLRAVASLLPRE